jgi:hypothetical protein
MCMHIGPLRLSTCHFEEGECNMRRNILTDVAEHLRQKLHIMYGV